MDMDVWSTQEDIINPNQFCGELIDQLLLVGDYIPDPIIKQARKSLIDFLVYDGEGRWIREPYLEILCNAVEQVVKGEILRLIVTLPPRHGKSQIISKKFPAWYLGNHPHNEIIITSYSADLAYDFSRVARDTLRYRREVFPNVDVSKSSSSVSHWGIEGGYDGGLTAAGVGGPITGRGAKIGIIDDPFKNYEEAQSDIIREMVWNWYITTFRTRLAPGGGIILVMTRWHEDDLVGRLIAKENEEDGEKWTVLNMSAIANDPKDLLGRPVGTVGLSQRYPESEIINLKKAIGLYQFNALYQGSPRPEEGNYFKKKWLPRLLLHDYPKGLFAYSSMDLAIEGKTQNDYNSITTIGVSPENEVFILDVDRFKGDTWDIVERIFATQIKWNPINFGFEDGQIRKTIWPIIEEEMRRRGVFINPIFLTPITDKLARARPMQARMRNGNAFFPVAGSTTWIDDLTEEILSFPNGRWDDQVDSLAWAFIMLTKVNAIGAGIDLDSIAH